MFQEYLFIPLDIFEQIVHDKAIEDRNELELWLTFLTADDPEDVSRLIDSFPSFKEIYQEIYAVCQDVEGAVTMYNELFHEADMDSLQVIYDQMQQERDILKDKLKEAEAEKSHKDALISDKNAEISNKDALISDKNAEIRKLTNKIKELENRLADIS